MLPLLLIAVVLGAVAVQKKSSSTTARLIAFSCRSEIVRAPRRAVEDRGLRGALVEWLRQPPAREDLARCLEATG